MEFIDNMTEEEYKIYDKCAFVITYMTNGTEKDAEKFVKKLQYYFNVTDIIPILLTMFDLDPKMKNIYKYYPRKKYIN